MPPISLLPGKIVLLNDDDDNNNGIPDFSDAPFRDAEGVAMIDDDLVRVNLALNLPLVEGFLASRSDLHFESGITRNLVADSPRRRLGMNSDTESMGDCFKAAYDYVVYDADQTEGLILVHGNVAHLPQDQERNHAWVELDGMVREVSNGQNRTIPKAEYYKTYCVTKTRRYKFSDALRLAADNHYGPWGEN